MPFDIWASPEGGLEEHLDRYGTREGALAKARTLLNAGRAVRIVPVPEGAPLPGGADDPLDIPPFLRRQPTEENKRCREARKHR